ncbi:permease-like cell division protein FtsX [Luteimicrobium subarcticum]|uniref:Cell division protein FtsX n=1 Tax=Luteimicrobium subarcticum TaxID=620910 RepID=A0A2M8WUD0_9MICO|nr:permease-like cell division protein FtsX [Luteimicrobium subarcticum]PJI94542.1 cell division protein FtsX [Luteimicrobium subarcticum]
MRAQYVLSEVGLGLRRNLTMVVAVILVTFVSLTFVGAAGLLQMQVGKLKDQWYGKVEVSVFLCPTGSTVANCASGKATEAQVDDLRDLLASDDVAPFVQKATFESQDEAFKEFQQRYPDGYDGTQLTADDMQASFRIKLTDPSEYEVVADVLTGRPGVEYVEDERRVFDSLFLAMNRASALAAGLAVVMLVAAVLLTTTTIRLSAMNRRRETEIMRLVGASNWFVHLPFMLEGAISAVVGAGLAVGGLWLGVKYVVDDWLAQSVTWAPYVTQRDVLTLAPALVGIAILLAVVASGVTLRRYTRV